MTDGTALYAGGSTTTGWRIEKRSAADGAFVAAFGNGGAAEPATNHGALQALVLTAPYLYTMGDDELVSPDEWRIEKRSAA